jgi:hypothetical protein
MFTQQHTTYRCCNNLWRCFKTLTLFCLLSFLLCSYWYWRRSPNQKQFHSCIWGANGKVLQQWCTCFRKDFNKVVVGDDGRGACGATVFCLVVATALTLAPNLISCFTRWVGFRGLSRRRRYCTVGSASAKAGACGVEARITSLVLLIRDDSTLGSTNWSKTHVYIHRTVRVPWEKIRPSTK